MAIDHTHDPSARSWVESAQGHAQFPIQNLPFGVFSHSGGARRIGVAIGDDIVDLAALARHGLLPDADALHAGTLNALLALDPGCAPGIAPPPVRSVDRSGPA